MGHEYVELKNTAAAVDAYRHAVDISPKDYRAWYGLGQTYEILAMPYYALFYYRKATALRPYDSRMWCAMAGCYKQLGKKPEAIKCYQRAESNNDREGIALTELARLFREENDRAQAAKYFREMLKLRELQEVSGETQEALLFLAYYCKDTGELQEAQQHCSRLLDIGGQARHAARAQPRIGCATHATCASACADPRRASRACAGARRGESAAPRHPFADTVRGPVKLARRRCSSQGRRSSTLFARLERV
jgi:anaphase-promoting complex subunit 8